MNLAKNLVLRLEMNLGMQKAPHLVTLTDLRLAGKKVIPRDERFE